MKTQYHTRTGLSTYFWPYGLSISSLYLHMEMILSVFQERSLFVRSLYHALSWRLRRRLWTWTDPEPDDYVSFLFSGSFYGFQDSVLLLWRTDPSRFLPLRVPSSFHLLSQKFNAVWTWTFSSHAPPPSTEAPPSWTRRVRMLRRR